MKISENFDLTYYNSYRLKAICAKAFFPESEYDVVTFFDRHKDFVLLGSGHNVILSKEYYSKPFLIFNGNYDGIINNDHGLFEIESGALMSDVADVALNRGFGGIEIFHDIPSSLGGAVVMNAGAYGEEIKDVLVKVRYLDLRTMKVLEIPRDEMDFEYRNSFFQRNTDKIVLKAWLKLEKKDEKDIREKMDFVRKQRWEKQPKEYPNAGSVFKRPKGYYVGAMIDELKLKGLTVGGAMVSKKHGGFIINFDSATGENILDLISEVRTRVRETFGIELEVEQRII